MIRRALAALFVASVATSAHAWTAPPDPDASNILREAREDADAGRFPDALDKQLWVHRESLKYESGFYGVRLSFALMQWKKLGDKYPPALDALRAIRDETSEQAKTVAKPFAQFHDVAAINGVLGDMDRTAELFAWLDVNRPDAARMVYQTAQKSLVVTKRYALCGKYLDGPAETDRIVGMYRMNRGMEKADARFRSSGYAPRSFTSSASMLVALLAVNGRTAEANAAREEFLKELPDDAAFRAQLNDAAAGHVPEPWPPVGG